MTELKNGFSRQKKIVMVFFVRKSSSTGENRKKTSFVSKLKIAKLN